MANFRSVGPSLLCLLLLVSRTALGDAPRPTAEGRVGPAGAAAPAPAAQTATPAAQTAAPAAQAVPAEEGDASEDLDQIVAGHVRRAEEATRRGQHQSAVTELRSAYQMDPQPVFLFKAGQAYQKAGQPKEALAMYRDYIDKEPAGPQRPAADAAIRELQLAALPDRSPVWKKGWFWAVIGGAAVVAVGLGVGLGLGLRGSNDVDLGGN